MLSLHNKTTVITGGGRGIGLALATAAADAGSNVAILDVLDSPSVDLDYMQSDSAKAKYYKTDVTDFGNLKGTFDEIQRDFGSIDNCVTCAGKVADKSFFDHEWADCQRLMNVNVMGTYFSAQLAAEHMRAQGTPGSIVMIASIASHCTIKSQRISFYAGTKGAVRIMAQHLAVELAPLNIRVNTISPGFTASAMTEQCAVTNPELYSVFTSAPPMGRMGTPDDLSPAVLYLLSGASSYTTGADIPITGGMHAGRILS